MTNQKIVRKSMLHEECESVTQSLKRKFGLGRILGGSKSVQEICQKINKVSVCKVSVIIFGETGTGKELAARAIHYLSNRAGKPFIPVNCGAIPENLFENELFGHTKGAFTDACLKQTGLVKEAEGGTLFLDEIGVLSPQIQVKLLRLLQNQEYKPLGETRPCKADIRIIAATNRDLQSLVKQDLFRKDLYYRLNIVSLYMPPLRDRIEDIPILAQHFMVKYSKEYNRPVKEFSEEAMRLFMSYSWPGNIRELENKIQQIIVMSEALKIDAEAIEFPINKSESKDKKVEHLRVVKNRLIDSFEKNYLKRLLIENRGNVVNSARMAGKSRTSLWNLIKKHNLSPKQFRY